MTFTGLIHDLIELNGRTVPVTTGTSDGNVGLACAGVISQGESAQKNPNRETGPQQGERPIRGTGRSERRYSRGS